MNNPLTAPMANILRQSMPGLLLVVIYTLLPLASAFGQSDQDAFFIRSVYDHSLEKSKCYDWLDTLVSNHPGRLAGSAAYDGAADYTEEVLGRLPIVDTTWQQSCTVPYWERGSGSRVIAHLPGNDVPLSCLALGNSVSTNGQVLRAEVIEVQSLDEVDSLGTLVANKIVFYNRPANAKYIRTFNAYGSAVDQRVYGASRAAKYGALAILVRSVTVSLDDIPHTGTLYYDDEVDRIPAIAISTLAANDLSRRIAEGGLEVSLKSDCRIMPERTSHNVIAEIRGKTYPEEIILVGGHLDSWDVGGGAHDDGAGCVQSMQVLETLQQVGYTPNRTIRCVLFSNEENGLGGATRYAEWSNSRGERHVLALESDSGGFSPRAFSIDGDLEVLPAYSQTVSSWLPLLEPYGMTLTTGGSGADVSRLKSQKGLLAGLRVDSQRYFDYHHTVNDQLEAVHPRELQLGAAAMTSLVYLVDKYGL